MEVDELLETHDDIDDEGVVEEVASFPELETIVNDVVKRQRLSRHPVFIFLLGLAFALPFCRRSPLNRRSLGLLLRLGFFDLDGSLHQGDHRLECFLQNDYFKVIHLHRHEESLLFAVLQNHPSYFLIRIPDGDLDSPCEE